jgi:predicted RNA-binding Zn ribbon-like protein
MSEPGQDWVWYGGRVSLDFVNTCRDREASPVEYLHGPGELAAWFRAAGLGSAPDVDAAIFGEALALRESIDAVMRATMTATAVPEPALRHLNDWLNPAAEPSPALRRAGDLVVFDAGPRQPSARTVLAAIALDAAQLAGSELRSRLRSCPGTHCGGRFLDRSAGGRRRWCSMAVCGNRQKATSHRQAAVQPR